MKLVSDQGESVPHRGGGGFNVNGKASMGGDFSEKNGVKLLRIEFPQSMQTVEAKFVFRDLPLP